MKNTQIKKGNSKKEEPSTKQTTIKLSIAGLKTKPLPIQINAAIVKCSSHSIKIEPLLNEFKCPILIIIDHPNLQTQIDMTGVSNQTILSFEEDGKFIGASLIGKSISSPIQFLNLGRLILIAPLNMKLYSNAITKITY
jgi:hypothetical protein